MYNRLFSVFKIIKINLKSKQIFIILNMIVWHFFEYYKKKIVSNFFSNLWERVINKIQNIANEIMKVCIVK